MIELRGDSIMVSGSMTIESVPTLVNAVTEHFAGGARHIDLSGVTEVDSSAVALFLEWQRQAADQGVNPVWRGIPAALQNLADLYGVQELLPVGA